MADARNKFMQPDEDTPFGRHLKEVTKYLNIGLPSFIGTFSTTLPEEERWKKKVWVPGRTFAPTTEPIDFYLDAPSWSIGKSMAAHITFGRICEVYHKELEKHHFSNMWPPRRRMGDDSYQEGWINCRLHSRDGRSYSSKGE